MNVLKSFGLAPAIACTALAAHAGFVTSEHATRDVGSSFIVNDSLNQRQWLGAEATRGLSYGAAQAAVASGGLYEGWRIATTADALLYQQALTGGGACSGSNAGDNTDVDYTCIGSAAAATVFGESYEDYNRWGYGFDYDYVSVISDLGWNSGGADLIESYSDGSSTQIRVLNWSGISSADDWADTYHESSFGFLLTRGAGAAAAAVAIPEPGSVVLVGLALLGVAATRRQRALVTHLTR